ncbi:hypothetical protein OS493_004804 [Desmophyllum pertusum]|uniref:BZIP domain-containing protein n=1 Tax=Desmophyllum pertusum TaxID=174260 RepID=A0A9W9ZIF5_9CNID|nr:hypothetical protein OS493_004804 [Desmophyllum pertusum]
MSFFFGNEAAEYSSEEHQPETTQVKMGLQKMIKLKYLEKGTDIPAIQETKIAPTKPKIKKENPDVIKLRRERNKHAAMKCRKRKRERIEKLEKKTNKLEEIRRKKQQEKAKLKEELRNLTSSLRNHCCKLNSKSTTAAADTWTIGLQGLPQWGPLKTIPNFIGT